MTSNGQELLAYTKANNLYYVDANGNEFAVTSDKVNFTKVTVCDVVGDPIAGNATCLLYTSPSPRDS